MTTATLTCWACSDQIEAYADEAQHLGRCCANLPAPWHMGRDGYYTQTTPRGEEPEDHDEEAIEPECEGCGSTTFEAIEDQTVWRRVMVDAGVMYVGDTVDSDSNGMRVVCEHCSEPYVGRWEYE